MQRHILQLGFASFLIATASAQITNPDKLVSPPPRNPALPHPHIAADDQWLWQYASPSNKSGLLADPRFTALLRDNLKAPQAFWSTPGSPLSDAARAFLAEGAVASTDNRYFTITGCVTDYVTDGRSGHCSQQRGLLWLDLGHPDSLLIFAALRWNEAGKIPGQPGAPFTLWIFPSKPLDAQQLPTAFKRSLAAWAESRDCAPYQISSAIVVDPSGVPHANGSLNVGVQPSVCTKSSGQQK